MQRKFLANLSLIILVNLLIKPLYLFGVDRSVQNVVGSADYGLYYALFNLTYIFSIVIDPGITNFNNRHIAQYEHLLTKYFSNITFIKLFLSVIYILLTITYAYFRGYSGIEFQLCFLLLLSQVFNSYVLYNRSNLAGLHLFKTDTFISILDKLLLILACLPFLLTDSLRSTFHIQTFILLQTGSFLVTALVSFFFVKRYTSSFRLKINVNQFRLILKESYPYAILAGLMLVYMKADTVLLKELNSNGNTEVGIYAAAYRLIDAMNMIAVLFAGLLYPIFSKMIKLGENINGMIKTGMALLVLPAAIFTCSSFFYRYEIISLLYENHVAESARIFGILLFSFIPICNSYIFGTLLTANGNIRLLNKIAFAGVCLNITANLVVIPLYGSAGAAYVSMLTFSLVSVLQTIYSFVKLNLNFRPGIIARIMLVLLITGLLSWALHLSSLHWFISILLSLGTGILSLLISRLLPLKELITIVKNQ